MPNSLKENGDLLQRLIAEGKLKPAPPAPPAPTAYPIPPAEPGLNPLLRSPMPANWGLNTDTARQWHNPAIPQTRILPLPPTGNPVVGAQAQSQAIIQIAATPAAASGVTSVGLTMPSIFVSPVVGSPVTSSGTLAVALTT